MKLIKLLFSFSLLFIFISNLNSQVQVIENTRFLKIKYVNQAPPNDRFVEIETLQILSSTNNSLTFKLNSNLNNEIFYSKGKKTFIIQGNDTILLYDYNLNENDTFFITQFNKDTFLVDSVRNKTLQDNNLYKHWYLRNLKKSHQLVWVENLGEKRSGWDYSKYNLMDFGGTIKSICLKNNNVYWYQEFNGFEPRQISVTCNFDSLKRLLSVNELNTYNLSIFPNPTISNLKIKGINSGKVLIYNSLGQLVLETYYENEINLSNLPNGTYNLVVYDEKKFLGLVLLG